MVAAWLHAQRSGQQHHHPAAGYDRCEYSHDGSVSDPDTLAAGHQRDSVDVLTKDIPRAQGSAVTLRDFCKCNLCFPGRMHPVAVAQKSGWGKFETGLLEKKLMLMVSAVFGWFILHHCGM